MSADPNPVLTFVAPTLDDKKGDKHLLVWGDLATWMVMDEELRSLAEGFDGKTPLGDVALGHATKWNRTREQMAREAGPILQHLIARGVIRDSAQKQAGKEEPLEIANVTLNTTNRCNLHCRFCYNERRTGEEVSTEALVDFLRAGSSALAADSSLIILGGEPTLDRRRLLDIIDGCAPVFARPPMISTNGTLLDAACVADLRERKVEVQVSVDSPIAAEHDAGRGQGVFDKAIKGICRLVEAGVHTIMSMVYRAGNLQQIEPYLDLAARLGVDEARFIPLRNAGAAGEYLTSQRPNQLTAFETLLDVLERKPEHRTLLARDFFSIAALQCRYSSSRVSCGIGRRVIFIDADGTIYPCPNHARPEYILGRVGPEPLQQMIETGKAAMAIRERYHVDRYTRCRDCAFKRWCAGDCRGEVIAVSKDPHAPSPHCAELRRMYKKILWMLAERDPRLEAPATGRDARDVFML